MSDEVTTAPLDAIVHLFVAFDFGYEIDLDAARGLLPAESGPVVRRRRTPESIRYRPAPLRLPPATDAREVPVHWGLRGPVRTEIAVFDFGAVSVVTTIPVTASEAGLLRIADDLADSAVWVGLARALVAPIYERLQPAITDPYFSELSEEYVVFQLGGECADLWTTAPEWLAGMVRLDAGRLSPGEVREATRLGLSYAPNDLVVLDWAAGVVADREAADTLQIVEFANVQLLEFRHIDDRLDDRLEAAYRLIHPGPRRRRLWAWRTHGDAVRSVRELEIEATSLFERAENALKLIGDQYLARVFGLASSRFHLGEWQASIRRKLDTVGDVYDLLVQQAGGVRTEALELIVIVLITLEVVLALVRH